MNKEIEEMGNVVFFASPLPAMWREDALIIAEKLYNAGYRKQSGWISVNDRLPERTMPPKDVLVYHDLGCGMFVDRAWYSYDRKRWCSVLGMKLKVTHWMPLPEPPKGEGK